MIRLSLLLLLSFYTSITFAQIRLDRLELKSKEEYKIVGSDILVVDTLIMGDSSRIILNKDVKENIINAKVVIAGYGSLILGHGLNATSGKIGAAGKRQTVPCRNGEDGTDGGGGIVGTDGINMSFYTTQLIIKGSLIINLNGGDGGVGGKGGKGGDGGGGTKVCKGGNGGNGGKGGSGGNGGHGGVLTFNCKKCDDLHQIEGTKLVIKSYGGYAGTGGVGGSGGQAGLSPLQDGKSGKRGIAGADGLTGTTGAASIEQK